MTKKSPLTNTKKRIYSILGGSVGNLVEWYDWYIYSSFSLYFAQSFFQKGNPTLQLLNTAAILLLDFLCVLLVVGF